MSCVAGMITLTPEELIHLTWDVHDAILREKAKKE
jgi:hypothetical protein